METARGEGDVLVRSCERIREDLAKLLKGQRELHSKYRKLIRDPCVLLALSSDSFQALCRINFGISQNLSESDLFNKPGMFRGDP